MVLIRDGGKKNEPCLNRLAQCNIRFRGSAPPSRIEPGPF